MFMVRCRVVDALDTGHVGVLFGRLGGGTTHAPYVVNNV